MLETIDLRVAVTGEVRAGKTHAEDLELLPALFARPGHRRLAWFDSPELVLAFVKAVVLAVVGDVAGRAGPSGPSR